jgi:hypothetical protein
LIAPVSISVSEIPTLEPPPKRAANGFTCFFKIDLRMNEILILLVEILQRF